MSEIEKLVEATKPFRDEIDKLRAEVEALKDDKVLLATQKGIAQEKLQDANLQIGEMRRDFGSIVIRCREGDPKVDWMPTILRIAEKHNINDSCKDPTDDERRLAKEAQDRKFRSPDWTRSGRHG